MYPSRNVVQNCQSSCVSVPFCSKCSPLEVITSRNELKIVHKSSVKVNDMTNVATSNRWPPLRVVIVSSYPALAILILSCQWRFLGESFDRSFEYPARTRVAMLATLHIVIIDD